jgi:DNA ligase 1
MTSLASLVELVGRIRATSSRTAKASLIAGFLRPLRGREAGLCALFLTGSLRQGRIGVGWRTIEAALAEAGPDSAPAPLGLLELDDALAGLATTRGAGSAERRAEVLRALFGRTSEAERRFLVELLLGEVRQGALEGLVREAIAEAASLPPERVREAAMFAEDLGALARAALEEGAAGLSRFSLRLLSPVAPMLASPAADVEEALDRLGEAAFEWKLDGARVQLHKAGNEVRVFTRQLSDVTERVPEMVEWARGLAPRELVLEGEALVLREGGRPQPFQVTMRRFGRSRNVEAARRTLPLSFFFFDCLHLEGEGALLAAPYADRFERLARTVPGPLLLPRIVTARPEEAAAFVRGAIEAGHEGVMAKSLAAPYVAGQRGFHWLKLKPAHTLDLVVLAAEWGSGRRRGLLSNLHLGARDPASGGFVMLGKTFKGLTDAALRWQTEQLLLREVKREEYVVHVRPELVVEIAFGEVQESPRYPAGLALRFARVKRYRPDKSAAEADTLAAVASIFEAQRGLPRAPAADSGA